MLLLFLGVAQRRQRVGSFARLRDEDRKAFRRERYLAITEFGGHIDLHRQVRKALEPIFGDEASVKGGAAGRDRKALDVAEIERLLRHAHTLGHHVEIMLQLVPDDLWLLVDFLRLVIAL